MNDESSYANAFTQMEESKILSQWLGTVHGLSNYDKLQLKSIPIYDEAHILEALEDGVCITEALVLMDPNTFSK